MFEINVIIVYLKVVSAIAIAIAIAVAGTAVYLQSGIGSSTDPSFSELKAGTHITITENDTKMMGGAAIVSFETNGYYAVEYNLDLKNKSILTGSWTSTDKSLVWVFIDIVA